MAPRLNVAIYLFDNVEVLDFAGPFEVFSTASRVQLRLTPQADKPFEVFTIARTAGTILARGSLVVQPRYLFSEHPPVDVLIVPGGIVSEELEREQVVRWISKIAQTVQVTASVCTGSFLLAKAGLLNGKKAITHWEDIDDLARMFPGIKITREARWVDEGSVVTSAGISAGIDMALHLVSRFTGTELASLTARQMDYPWLQV